MSTRQPDAPEIHELDVDDLDAVDLEQATREALAAVTDDEPASSEPPAEAAAMAELVARAERAEAEVAVLREGKVRLLADFDNYRKRADREREDTRRFAVGEPLRDVLEVADNLERALAAQGSHEDLRRGVEMIAKQTQEVLRRHQVVEVPAAGQPFDPAFHEAVARVEDPTVSVAMVLDVYQRGYRLHDRLLRPALVRVAVPSSQPAPPASDPAPSAPADPASEPETP